MPVQQPQKSQKWCLKTPKSVQNEVQTATWNHQIQEKVKKAKSNENISIYHIKWEVGTSEISIISTQKSTIIMPAIQTCFLTLQITENIKKWSKMVSKGTPKIHQKSLKIYPGTFQGPSQCICDPLDCKMVPKWCPRTFKWSQNGHPRTLKVNENQQAPTTNYVTKKCILWLVLHWFQSWRSFKSC